MGWRISYNRDGVQYKNTYHRVYILEKDKKTKDLVVGIKIYANKAHADESPYNYFDHTTVRMSQDDFDSYIGVTTYVNGQTYPERSIYEFLSLMDVLSDNSPYKGFRFNYRDEAVQE